MKKVIYFLMLLFTANYINAQSPIRHISRSHFLYYGADSSVNVMRDSGNYFGTTKDFFDFNKPIKVNGTAIGGGGETLGNPSTSGMLLKSTTDGVRSWGYPSYVRNYNLTDTFSVLRTVPSGKIGNYTRSVSGIYDRIDSVNSSGYIGYVGTNSGYFVRIGTNTSGGYIGHVNTNNSGGYVGSVDTNNGYVGRVGTNNSGGYVGYVPINSGYVGRVDNNSAGGYVGLVPVNSGNIGRVGNNEAGGYVGYVENNSAGGYIGLVTVNSGNVGRVGNNSAGGNVWRVDNNSAGGYVGYVYDNSGICNTVKNKKSTTIPTSPIISAQVYYNNIQKWYRDSIGLPHGEIPSATGFDTTVNLSVNLTADVWQKVTNSTNNLWSLSNTASYMTFSADTIKNTYAGKYEYSFSLSVNGKDAATYEYRVMKKTGATVSVIRKIKITGGGVNVERIINCAPLLAAGDKVWVEIRFIGSPTGSPISIFGSYFTAKAVYLSL